MITKSLIKLDKTSDVAEHDDNDDNYSRTDDMLEIKQISHLDERKVGFIS